jgi:UDP:flavonoid glycosyltransferase YjiC (YdhE family)
VIFVGVGTFAHGFDELVAGADRAAAALGIEGFAQIGHSRVVPRHLDHARFLGSDELAARLGRSEVAVCHAGMGLVGDALRAGCRLVLVPRQGSISRRHPANDQRRFAERLAAILPLRVCTDPADLAGAIRAALDDAGPPPAAPPSTVPAILQDYLRTGARGAAPPPQSRPASSS